MNFNSFRPFLMALILAVVLTITFTMDVFAQPVTLVPNHLAVMNTLKGTTQKIEGKVQETIGNLNGDRETQIEGKVKQAEGDIRASVPRKPSEAELERKIQQAESNIRRYQSSDRKAVNLKDALQ